jgi:two-component system OmpR family sensor kinase
MPATDSSPPVTKLLPRSLRGRLAVAISLITTLVVAGSFFAIHQGTGSELQRRIDSDLREQFGEFQQQSLGGVESPAALGRAAKRFISSQRYHPESRIFLIEVKGGADVTNQRDVVAREVEAESTEAGGRGGGERESTLLDAPTGFTDVSTEDAGRLRVYSRPIIVGSRELGAFRVADPRVPIERAQSGLRQTFLVVGALALVVSVAVGVWVATLITRPLRRMARVASEVDAGELTHRLGRVGSSVEITSLAESFDHMLDRLESAFQGQREFVSDASHELRTPLTVLRGQIELLAREGDETKRRQTIETAVREIDHMNRLIDDMLILARAEAGDLVHPRKVELADFLHDLERDLPLFGRRDYRVEGPREGIVVADPDRLSQVVRNLVRNAVNHTEIGQPITVTATPRGDSLRFTVADSGPGIPQDQLERVFDRFYRTDSGRARDEGGSGLGLAIARAIVEAHGGRIWADVSSGEGARISFELPGYSRATSAAVSG